MAALVASDISYTVEKVKKMEDGRKLVHVKMVFGDGVKTYPSGGVALSNGKMGCGVNVDSLEVYDIGSGGYVPRFDKANGKLMLFQVPAAAALGSAAPMAEVANTVAPAAQTMKATVIGY